MTKSLETKDQVKATTRAAQAIKQLQQEAERQGQSKWYADEPGIEWTIPSNPDGSNDYANAVAKPIVAADVLEPDQIKQIDWKDLIREADKERKRDTGKAYSPAWHDQAGLAVKRVPFTLQEATPEKIRKWMDQMTKEGLSAKTLQINCGVLAGLINTSIKSGLLAQLEVNPFTRVSYTTKQKNHLYTAVEEDYRGIKDLLPQLPEPQRVALLMQAYLGTRISEITERTAEDFDLDKGEMKITHLYGDNKASRVIPLPQWLCEELKGFDFKWPTRMIINTKLKKVNPKLTTHSFRHGMIKLGRDLKAHPDPIEVMVGHKLKGMKDEYGRDIEGFIYGVDALRDAVVPLWTQLKEWVG